MTPEKGQKSASAHFSRSDHFQVIKISASSPGPQDNSLLTILVKHFSMAPGSRGWEKDCAITKLDQ